MVSTVVFPLLVLQLLTFLPWMVMVTHCPTTMTPDAAAAAAAAEEEQEEEEQEVNGGNAAHLGGGDDEVGDNKQTTCTNPHGHNADYDP